MQAVFPEKIIFFEKKTKKERLAENQQPLRKNTQRFPNRNQRNQMGVTHAH